MDELTPTSGSAWRRPREEGVLVRLPSGNVARLRPVALDVLLAQGRIPDLLTPVAARTLWMEQTPEQMAEAADVAKGTLELFNLVCRASFVSPRVVDEPQADDEIGLEDISLEDKLTVFTLAIQGARALERFRLRQGAGVDPVPGGQANGAAAE